MSPSKRRSARRPAKRGPPPDTLTLAGPWAEKVKRALSKKRPKRGWPKHSGRRGK